MGIKSSIKLLQEVLRNEGLKYLVFRSQYEIRKRYGFLKRKFPVNPPVQQYVTLQDWKTLNIPYFFSSRASILLNKTRDIQLAEDYKKITSGQICYFNNDWNKRGDWLTHPVSGKMYDIKKHWTEIDSLDPTIGDIKYVWEKSRFSYLLTIIRYDYHYDADSSQFVFDLMEDWMDNNPVNLGPNYHCSQETSLRCMNWIFTIYFYKNSKNLTEAFFQKLMHFVYWQIQHVYQNINFSRICVRNNHAVTECLMLWMGGVLFPFFPESSVWQNKGKKYLEEELLYQIYDDGTYIQYSHNYHRVLIQLLSHYVALSEKHKNVIPEIVKEKIRKTLDYLSSNIVGESGQVPNYGSNDGALFFPLSSSDYTDFRPQINALGYILNGKYKFSELQTQEEGQWMKGNKQSIINPKVKDTLLPIKKFNVGGIYHINDGNTFTFFKCASYKDRPAQADNMHIDIWVNGQNYLRDSGTYRYNTEQGLVEYFTGTRGHNSVMINGLDQMEKGPRFIWYEWTRNTKVSIEESPEEYFLIARAEMFLQINPGIFHIREIHKLKGKNEWTIIDRLETDESDLEMEQIWHPNPSLLDKITIETFDDNNQRIDKQKEIGFWSAYYGKIEEVPVWKYSSNKKFLKTKITIQP